QPVESLAGERGRTYSGQSKRPWFGPRRWYSARRSGTRRSGPAPTGGPLAPEPPGRTLDLGATDPVALVDRGGLAKGQRDEAGRGPDTARSVAANLVTHLVPA